MVRNRPQLGGWIAALRVRHVNEFCFRFVADIDLNQASVPDCWAGDERRQQRNAEA